MMTSCGRFPFLRLTLVFLGAVALSGLLWKVAAYQFYSDNTQPDGFGNCATCHETLPNGGGFWGGPNSGPLHIAHQNNATGTCRLCHTSTGDVPQLNSSSATGGVGCIGCHGQPLGTGVSSGAGLRRHHARSGVSVCATCHTSDPVPPPESTVPVYYGFTDVLQTTPCNTDGMEDFWTYNGGPQTNGKGLDNDGDLLVDYLFDPDCGAVACVDGDGDGYGDPADPSCAGGLARDCDDTRATVYPGAVEAYDLLDNNCNGQIDEIEKAGFNDPTNRLRLTWLDQLPTGQLYDVIRSDSPQFVATSPNSTCLVVGTNLTAFDDTLTPAARAVFYYLVRNTLVNDYGKDSRGNLRLYTLCP
jgi:hypothetical protein